jgi:hypothetical protein
LNWSPAGSLRALIAHALQRLVLRSAATPLRRAWAVAYAAIARVSGFVLTRGVAGAAVYVRAGAAGGELLPGMSDIDLALVAPAGAGAERIRRRWAALMRRAPWVARLIDRPLIFDQAELAIVAGRSARTFGLAAGDACYFGERPTLDWIRTLEHPGLDGVTSDWRLLRGTDRRPAPAPRDSDEERLAVWSEVLLWWRWASIFCDQPRAPRAADVCVKLIAQPARAWLWLAHRERADSRVDALWRLARRLEEEEPAARLALDLQRRLPSAPEAPFGEVLPAFVRMTRRIDRLIAGQIADAGLERVALAGDAGDADALPLVDWPAVTAPAEFAETFAVVTGDPGDPQALASAVRAHRLGFYRALRSEDLLVLPGRPLPRTRMRAVKSRLTDPVSFALLDGESVAAFPRVRGLSATDLAARAVAEHRAWLRTRRVPPRPWSAPPPACYELGMLLSAARAALFCEAVGAGEPELVVGHAELGRRLGPAGEEAVAAHADSAASGAPPPAVVVAGLEGRVGALPGYA